MKPDKLLRAILPEVLIDNFDIDRFEKSESRFDIWLDEKKEQLLEVKHNKDVICYGFRDYHTIQDYPIRRRATYLHVRQRKWLDKSTGDIFSYQWDVSEFDGTRLNAEFVDFLKREIESSPGSISTLAARNGLNNEINKVLETFEIHNTTIINYFERRLTNASAESLNAKIKAFRTQFRESATSSSSCSDWPHYTPDISPPCSSEKSAGTFRDGYFRPVYTWKEAGS